MNGLIVVVIVGALLAPTLALGQQMEIDKIVAGAYLRDSTARAGIADLTMAAESFARRLSGDNAVKEEKKFLKTYYFKDTLFRVDFLEYSLDGVRQDSTGLAAEIKDAADRRKKGRMRDATIRPLEPFYPDHRADYEFALIGTEEKQGRPCYRIAAECLRDDESLLNGQYWFETTDLNLVYTEFHPAKLPSPLKQLDMQMWYAPVADGVWLQERFHLLGRGQVMLFIKFRFEVEERYFNHAVNTGLADDFFKETRDE